MWFYLIDDDDLEEMGREVVFLRLSRGEQIVVLYIKRIRNR